MWCGKTEQGSVSQRHLPEKKKLKNLIKNKVLPIGKEKTKY